MKDIYVPRTEQVDNLGPKTTLLEKPSRSCHRESLLERIVGAY
jgi:hypothetical protein